MSVAQLQDEISAQVASITDERELAQIRAFVLLLKADLIEGQQHWNALSVDQREQIISDSKNIDKQDGSWVPHDQVMNKYKKWLAQ